MYDFDAGDISLNFANTKLWHASLTPEEYLCTYTDFLLWGQRAGLISPKQVDQLTIEAQTNSEKATLNYELAIQVREAIYNLFSAHCSGKPYHNSDLAILNRVAGEAMANLQLIEQGGEFKWQFPTDVDGATLILWTVGRTAADLLTSEKVKRMRECEDDRGCGYLFIDQTKNHSRRWCSMESCGNRAKARRHYARLQGE